MNATNHIQNTDSLQLAFEENVGITERAIRYVLTAMLVSVIFVSKGTLSWEVYAPLLSVYTFITAVMGWDPIYEFLGVSTTEKRTDAPHQAYSDNVGTTERGIRYALSGGLVSVVFVSSGVLSWEVYAPLLSVYTFVTAVMGWDPIYEMLGVSSAAEHAEETRLTTPVAHHTPAEMPEAKTGTNDTHFHKAA
jgi:hypothetical protein